MDLRWHEPPCMRHCDMVPEAPIHDWPLSYASRLDRRRIDSVDLVVIHCTELPDLQTAREFGERIHHLDSGTGNSGHYYIDVDGTIHRFVADDRVAHHTFGYNPRSIGIELSNIGRYPHWNDSRHQAFSVDYTQAQIESLLDLLRRLGRDLPSLRFIAGHEDLDLRLQPADDDPAIMLRRLQPADDDPAIMLRRRQDPGPLFPWDRVVPASGLQRLKP